MTIPLRRDLTSIYHSSIVSLLAVIACWKGYNCSQPLIWFSFIVASSLLCIFVFWPILLRWFIANASIPPSGNPTAFMMTKKNQIKQKNERTLVCVGDSITCGKVSANYVEKVEHGLRQKNTPFKNYQWNVVNAGVNSITTFHVYKNIQSIINCNPDFVTILIGTNDIKALVNNKWKKRSESISNGLMSFGTYELNLTKIVRKILEETNAIVALCTIPPLGEDLSSEVNSLYIHEANNIIRKVKDKDEFVNLKRLFLFDTNYALKQVILKHNRGRLFYPQIERFLTYLCYIYTLHEFFGFSWNTSSNLVLGPSRNILLSDSIHLNDLGAEKIASTIIDGLHEVTGRAQ